MDPQICKICSKSDGEQNERVSIKNKGATGLNEASKKRGDGREFKAGDRLHKVCRRDYTNANNIASTNSPTINALTPKKTRASQGSSFNFRTNCFLCGNCLTDREITHQDYVSVLCKDKEVDISLKRAIEGRKYDRWAIEVQGRLASCNDLRAEDAVYHRACNSNFRTGKDRPKYYDQDLNSASKKRGRPSDQTKENAFAKVIDYLIQNDEEQITIEDLTGLMSKYCEEPYSNKYMKQKLEEHFSDEIIFSHIDGKSNIVTFLSTAKKILAEFNEFNDPAADDIEVQKSRIVATAAKIIRNEVKALGPDKAYPSINQFQSIQNCLDYIPPSLKTLLETLITRHDNIDKL